MNVSGYFGSYCRVCLCSKFQELQNFVGSEPFAFLFRSELQRSARVPAIIWKRPVRSACSQKLTEWMNVPEK